MSLHLPEGKRLAVNIGVDFDAHSVWHGAMQAGTNVSASLLSRGEFGARVGLPRLLGVLERYGVTGTFFTPSQDMCTFPEEFGTVLEAGHEIGAHGCYHEHIPALDGDEERRLMTKALEIHEKYVGKRPRGYRSPAWDFTDVTQAILEDAGFEYDSSLMGRDFQAYRPRPVIRQDLEEGNTFGEESRLVEYPVSWHLDDFPALEYIPGTPITGYRSTEMVLQAWTDQFDYAYENEPGGVFCLTVHPQCIGRGHHIKMFERFLQHVAGHDGVWFAPLGDVHDTWQDD